MDMLKVVDEYWDGIDREYAEILEKSPSLKTSVFIPKKIREEIEDYAKERGYSISFAVLILAMRGLGFTDEKIKAAWHRMGRPNE